MRQTERTSDTRTLGLRLLPTTSRRLLDRCAYIDGSSCIFFSSFIMIYDTIQNVVHLIFYQAPGSQFFLPPWHRAQASYFSCIKGPKTHNTQAQMPRPGETSVRPIKLSVLCLVLRLPMRRQTLCTTCTNNKLSKVIIKYYTNFNEGLRNEIVEGLTPQRRLVQAGRVALLNLEKNSHWCHLVVGRLHLSEFY